MVTSHFPHVYYIGSDEELADLRSAYTDYEGDMDRIMDSVLCATPEDEPRFRQILTDLITNKALPDYKAFTKEKKSKVKERKRRVCAGFLLIRSLKFDNLER